MRMVPARFDDDAFQLYKKYQVAVHGDKPEDVTREQYERFLVHSPLKHQPHQARLEGLGSADLDCGSAARGAAEKRVAGAAAAAEEARTAAARLAQLLPVLANTLNTDVHTAEKLLVAFGCSSRRLLQAARPLAPVLASLPAEQHRGVIQAQLHVELDDDASLQDAMQAALVEPLDPREYRAASVDACAAAWQHGEGAAAGIPLLPAQAAQSQGAAAAGGGSSPKHSQTSTAPPAGSDMRLGYGSFHQKYYAGDRLVAVGVVDVLPLCLSSVYLFYDPDLPQLSLGKYTALAEIAWVRAAAAVAPRLHYYYMGYYVASCSKMRYKGDYQPSELLCPKTLRWVPLAAVAARLQQEQCFDFAAHALAAAPGGGGVAEGTIQHFPAADAWIPNANQRDCLIAAACSLFLLAPRGKSAEEVLAAAQGADWAQDALHAKQLQAPGSAMIMRMLARLIKGMGAEIAFRIAWAV